MIFDEALIRRVLASMGFEEVRDGLFVRLDAPGGRARRPQDARFVTTVKLAELLSGPEALRALVKRFPRVHGAPVR